MGWGRVYEGYLLVGKLVGEPAPTKFTDSIRKISICVNPHQRLSRLGAVKKKPNYMVGALSPISLTNTNQ